MLSIRKSLNYAESNITIVGITREIYGRPQYFIVNSDEGRTPELKFPGRKNGCYVVESLDEHRDRITQKGLRMPDMIPIGEQFYRSSPGEKIPLTQFCFSGII